MTEKIEYMKLSDAILLKKGFIDEDIKKFQVYSYFLKNYGMAPEEVNKLSVKFIEYLFELERVRMVESELNG